MNQIKFKLGKIRMMPGIYSYRFQCVMPPSIPSSVEGSIGHIRYSACLTIDIPMFQSKDFQQQFIVLKPISLQNYPVLRVSFCPVFFYFSTNYNYELMSRQLTCLFYFRFYLTKCRNRLLWQKINHFFSAVSECYVACLQSYWILSHAFQFVGIYHGKSYIWNCL